MREKLCLLLRMLRPPIFIILDIFKKTAKQMLLLYLISNLGVVASRRMQMQTHKAWTFYECLCVLASTVIPVSIPSGYLGITANELSMAILSRQ